MDKKHIPEQDEPIEDPAFYDFSVTDLETDKEIQKKRIPLPGILSLLIIPLLLPSPGHQAGHPASAK